MGFGFEGFTWSLRSPFGWFRNKYLCTGLKEDVLEELEGNRGGGGNHGKYAELFQNHALDVGEAQHSDCEIHKEKQQKKTGYMESQAQKCREERRGEETRQSDGSFTVASPMRTPPRRYL